MIITTLQGDTFDIIAKRLYGNERAIRALLEANPAHALTVVFSAGIELEAPDAASTTTASADLPPWRKA